MAVEIGRGGLSSVGSASQQAGAIFKTPTGSRGSFSSGSGGQTSGGAKAQAIREATAQREEIARQEAMRQQNIRQDQERARQEAEQKKREELSATRNQRVAQAEKEARDIGVLPGVGVRNAVIAREERAIRKAGQEAVVKVGTTGKITRVRKPISSSTITVKPKPNIPPKKGGTSKTPQQPRVDAFTVEDVKGGFSGQSLITSTKQSIQKLFNPSTRKQTDVDKDFRLGTIGSKGGTAPKETFTEKVLEPFKFTGTFPGDKQSIIPTFGTIDSNAPTTRGGVERERVRTELFTKGEADITQLSGLFSETGTFKIAKNIPTAVETSAIVGASLIPGAQLPLGVALVGSGIKKGVDITQAEKEGVIVPLIDKIDVGARVGFGLSGVVGATSAIERALLKSEFQQLSQSNINFKGITVTNEKQGFATLNAEQKLNDLTTEFSVSGKFFKEGEKTLLLPKGEGTSTTFGKVGTNVERDFQKGTKVLSSQSFGVESKTFNLGEIDGFIKTSSRTTTIPESSIGVLFSPTKDLPSKGLLQYEKNLEKLATKSTDATLKKIFVDSRIEGIGKKLGKSLEIGGKAKTTFSGALSQKSGTGQFGEDIIFTRSSRIGNKGGRLSPVSEDIGFTSVFRTDKTFKTGFETGDSGIKKYISKLPTEKRTPLSSTFGTGGQATQQISKVVSPIIDFKGIAEATSKSLASVIPKSPKLTSSFAGLGVYERTSGGSTKQEFSNIVKQQQSFSQAPRLSVKQSNNQIQGFLSPPKLTTKTSNKSSQRNKTITKTIQQTGLASAQTQNFISATKKKQTTANLTGVLTPSPPSIRIPRTIPITVPIGGIFMPLPKPKAPKFKRESFGVQILGEKGFRGVGAFGSISGAVRRGSRVSLGTSAKGFRVTGVGRLPGVVKGFTKKKTAKGIVFIEKKKKKTKRGRG